MDWILVVVLGVMCLGSIAGNVIQAWLHSNNLENTTENLGHTIFNLNENIQLTVRDNSKRMVEVVMEFSKRLREIEDLALIEQKERRVYLGMAESRIAQQKQMQAEAIRSGQPVYPPGFFDESQETAPEEDPTSEQMATGWRRGSPPPQAEPEVDEPTKKETTEEQRA